MNEIRPVRFEDFDNIALRDSEKKFIQRMGSDFIVPLIQKSVHWTLLCENNIIAIGGVLPLWEGVGEVWLFPSVLTQQYSILFLRSSKRIIDNLAGCYSFHRLQTHTLADALHDRWMTYLGFEYEGFCPQYSATKQDYRVWGRVDNGR